MSAEPHIVIIGGGFSGAAVAIELLRLAPNGVRVTLLEPRQSPGPGWPTPPRSRRTGLTFRPLACSWPATKRAPSIIGTAISLPLPSMCRRCARTVPSTLSAASLVAMWRSVLPTPRRPAADGFATCAIGRSLFIRDGDHRRRPAA